MKSYKNQYKNIDKNIYFNVDFNSDLYYNKSIEIRRSNMKSREPKYPGRAYLLGIPLWKVELSEEMWQKSLVSYRTSKGNIFYYKPSKEDNK